MATMLRSAEQLPTQFQVEAIRHLYREYLFPVPAVEVSHLVQGNTGSQSTSDDPACAGPNN